jgi:DNA-binding PadR family transcriptional regulator
MNRHKSDGDARRFLPLPSHDFSVLLTLADGACHAYGLVKAVESQPDGGVRLELGSLYRMLARLTTAGVIEETRGSGDEDSVHASRRKYYRLTPFGRRVAVAEAARLQAVIRLARRRRLVSAKSDR